MKGPLSLQTTEWRTCSFLKLFPDSLHLDMAYITSPNILVVPNLIRYYRYSQFSSHLFVNLISRRNVGHNATTHNKMYILVVQLSKLNDHLPYTIYNNQLKNGNNTKQQQQQQQGNNKLS